MPSAKAFWCRLVPAACLAWALATAPSWAKAPKTPAPAIPAEKVRAALDQSVTLDFTSQNFQEAIDHLKQKTGVSFALDTLVLQQMGIGIGEIPTPVVLKSDKGKVRAAVQRMLDPYHLTYVVLGETVLITTQDVAHYRQLRQRVAVDFEKVPLKDALETLARQTGTEILIDPRAAKEAQGPVTLRPRDDMTLEDAVRLLSFLGGLKPARVGNVLFVTTEERADKLLRTQGMARPPVLGGPPGVIEQGGIGGFFPGVPRFMPVPPVAPPAPPGGDAPAKPPDRSNKDDSGR